MANTVIYQKRGAEKVKVAETPDLSPYAIKADVDAELATKADAEDLGITDKRVDNLAALMNGALSMQNTDSTSAYAKTVPAKAQPYAAINAVGGKTVVWNQLNKQNAPTQTKNDITFTNNGNGTWTITGTPSAGGTYIYTGDGIPIIYGHKYIIATSGEPSGVETNCAWYAGSTYVGNVESNTIVTPPDSTVDGMTCCKIGVNSTLVGTALNFTMKTTFIDLTLMFGAGNEPSTVAEFQAMFPTINPAYNPGQLISAGVTGAVSHSLNLLDPTDGIRSEFQVSSDYVVSQKNTSSMPLGWSYANSTWFVELDAGDYVFSYTVTKTTTSANAGLYIRDASDTVLKSYTNQPFATAQTVNMTAFTVSAKQKIGIQIKLYDGEARFWLSKTNAIPFEPPIIQTLPIPAAVQSLPGYGWSAGTAYNYIDWQRKVYVQRVGSYTFTSSDTWTYFIPQEGRNTFNCGTRLPIGRKAHGSGVMSQNYVWEDKQSIVAQADKTFCFFGSPYLSVRDDVFTDAASFAQHMAGVTLYYELETPVETDISQYLSDDNLLAVEPGGTVSFPSVLGDGYRIPVPSDVEYTIDLAPDTPSTDGTYTLQCVVADGVATYEWVSA